MKMSAQEEAALLSRVRSGDPAAAEEAVLQYSRLVHSIAAYFRVMAGTSLKDAHPRLPVHRQRELAGLSTSVSMRFRFSSQVIIRGSPKIGYGGSSG